MTIDILICTIDDGVCGVGQVLMPPMPGVRYVVSMQHTRPLDEVAEWGSVLTRLRQRDDVTVLTLEGRGLSRNRNHALRAAKADILIIADDDCRYKPEHIAAIRSAYEVHPEADAICFETQTYDGLPMKRYPESTMSYDEAERVGYFPISIEITLRRIALERSGVMFNERFGLGATPFTAGEEDILVTDLQQAGLYVMFIPSVIAFTDAVTTSDRFLIDPRLQMTKGAVFRYRYGLADALWRTVKEGGYHFVHSHANPASIWWNMLKGIMIRI